MAVHVSTPWFTLSHDEARGLWRLTRSDTPVAIADVERAFIPIHNALRGVDRARAVLLIDVRGAPLRNDATLEVAIDHQIRRVVEGFRKFAVLVRTSAGALQVSRVSRQEHQQEPFVCREERDALAFLAV